MYIVIDQKVYTRTLADEIDGFLAYLGTKRGLSSATVFHYSHDLSLLLRYLARTNGCEVLDVTIEMATSEAIQSFFTYLSEGRQNCVRSNKRRLAAVRSFFNYIYSQTTKRSNTANPVGDITVQKAELKPPQILTDTQVMQLLRAARSDGPFPVRDYALLRLFLHCGASLSEVLNAQLQDVNLTSAYIRLAWGTSHSRVVPLSEETRHAIAQYIICRPNSNTERLFLNHRGQPITKGTVYHLLAKCKSYAKLSPDTKINSQVLRHTCFGRLAKEGFSVSEIQALAGLRSSQMARSYVRLVQPSNKQPAHP
jgi:integrase/recombinase XerD